MKLERQFNTTQQIEDPDTDPKNDGWMGGVQQDLETRSNTDWKVRIQDRDY